jgi:hypothetical protein
MKPNDIGLNPYVEMPAWLRALLQAASDDSFAAPGSTLGPVGALDELISLEGFGGAETAADRSSLQRDLGAALGALGPELAASIDPALADFRRFTLARVPELLRTRESVGIASASARVLREVLVGEVAVRAAWRDVVSAFEEDGPYEHCLGRLAVLREVVEAHGHAWEVEAELIARVINDSAEYAARAGAQVPPPADGRRHEVEERAGLAEEERIALIEAHLSRPPTDEEIVVWLLISDAVVSEKTIDLGAVRFFDTRMLRSRLRFGPIDPRPFGLPRDLEPFVAARLLEDLDAEEQAVLARVEVKPGRAGAIGRARDTVTGLLDIATLGEPRPGWKLETGHLLISGSGWSHLRFRYNGGLRSINFDRWTYRPDRSLAQLDPELARAWHDGDPATAEAVELARWERSLQSSTNEAFRVALGVRNLERVLPAERVAPAGRDAPHWAAVVSYYLKEVWCWEVLRGHLDEVRLHSLSAPTESSPEDSVRESEDFYERRRAIHVEEEINRRVLVEKASSLGGLFRPGSSRRRMLDTVAARTVDPASTLAWLSSLGEEFDVLLDRAARQRNAVVHGSPTVPTVIEATLPFVAGLGSMVAKAARDAAAARDPLTNWLERERLRALGDSAALRAGTAPGLVVGRVTKNADTPSTTQSSRTRSSGSGGKSVGNGGPSGWRKICCHQVSEIARF